MSRSETMPCTCARPRRHRADVYAPDRSDRDRSRPGGRDGPWSLVCEYVPDPHDFTHFLRVRPLLHLDRQCGCRQPPRVFAPARVRSAGSGRRSEHAEPPEHPAPGRNRLQQPEPVGGPGDRDVQSRSRAGVGQIRPDRHESPCRLGPWLADRQTNQRCARVGVSRTGVRSRTDRRGELRPVLRDDHASGVPSPPLTRSTAKSAPRTVPRTPAPAHGRPPTPHRARRHERRPIRPALRARASTSIGGCVVHVSSAAATRSPRAFQRLRPGGGPASRRSAPRPDPVIDGSGQRRTAAARPSRTAPALVPSPDFCPKVQVRVRRHPWPRSDVSPSSCRHQLLALSDHRRR